MAIDHVQIEGDDPRWKSVAEKKIKELQKAVDRLESRIQSIEGRLRKK